MKALTSLIFKYWWIIIMLWFAAIIITCLFMSINKVNFYLTNEEINNKKSNDNIGS